MNEYMHKSNNLFSSVNEARKTFQPDPESSKHLLILIIYIELMAPTRFSSRPPPPNTFLNFQPAPKTPGYIPESTRLNSKHLNTKVDF